MYPVYVRVHVHVEYHFMGMCVYNLELLSPFFQDIISIPMCIN